MLETIIIADTSSLISLSRIGRLGILKDLYSEIFITTAVKNEFAERLPPWVKVVDPTNLQTVKLLNLNLDPGESSAIALAIEREGSLLIIDERKGRRVAISMNLKVTGLLGVLLKAKQSKYLTSVKEVLIDLENASFRISDPLKKTILRLANED